LIESHGHRTILAGRAGEALALLVHIRPTLVLTNHTLPDQSAWAFADQVRDILPGLPVIVLNTGPDDQPSAVRHRITACVDRPLTVEAILEAVGRVLPTR
jgi:CheY-like chemotaxis protein